MATFRLRHFSNPQVLRGVAPHRLLAFLNPYRDFFIGRDYELPADVSEELDYERLVNIFGPSGIIVGDGTIAGERNPQQCKTKSSINIS